MRIYQEILNENPKNPLEVHSDSFLSKLQSAIYLVRDDLMSLWLTSPPDKRKEIEFKFKALGTLNDASLLLHNNKELTMYTFEYINTIAALIDTDVDYAYYNEKNIFYAKDIYYFWNGDGRHKLIGAKEALAKGVEATIEFIRLRRGHDNFKTAYFPTAFIYSRENNPIGYRTFLGALLNKAFPLNITNFYPHLPKKPAKSDPHWGRTRVLVADIMHDLAHRTEIFRNINALKTTFGIYYFDLFRHVEAMIRDESITENNKKIITRGSFCLLHELFFRLIRKDQMIDRKLMLTVISKAQENNDIDPATLNNLAGLVSSLTFEEYGSFKKLSNPAEQEIIDAIYENAHTILSALPPHYAIAYLSGKFSDLYLKDLKHGESENYKETPRDFERIFFDILDENGRPVLPVITFGKKKKLCPVIKDNKSVAALIVGIDYEKGFVNLGPSKQPIPFQMDNNGVITLPSEYTLMSNEELKRSKYLYNLRQELAKAHLEIATMKFWRLFNKQMKIHFDSPNNIVDLSGSNF